MIECILAAAYFINRKFEKKTYPLSYKSIIMENSERYDLDFFLVAAVIHVESHNDPMALSPKGAMGLMQIMPDTGGWIYEKIEQKEDGFKEKDLYNSDINIRYGCWYLRYLLDKFDQDLNYALIAYNAGPGNLDKWLSDESISPGGRLGRIPFPQTEDYLGKVLSAKTKYEELYEKEIS